MCTPGAAPGDSPGGRSQATFRAHQNLAVARSYGTLERSSRDFLEQLFKHDVWDGAGHRLSTAAVVHDVVIMGITFSEPLEKLCLGVFVVFMTAAMTTGVQPLGGSGVKHKPTARAKKKSASRSPEPMQTAAVDAPVAIAAPPPSEAGAPLLETTREHADGRIVVDGVDLVDIVDVDLEPRTHDDWKPVTVRSRHKRNSTPVSESPSPPPETD